MLHDQALLLIGEALDAHVLAIYNKPEYRRLCEATRSRLDAAPCDACSFF